MPRPRARPAETLLVRFRNLADSRSPSSSLSTSDIETGLHSSSPCSSGLFVALRSIRGSQPAATTMMPGEEHARAQRELDGDADSEGPAGHREPRGDPI